MTAHYKVQGDVAIISMNNPPVNGLGYDTRVGITSGLDKANADPAVKAIVLTGEGKAFSGGADIREFNSAKAMQEPILLSVIVAVENSPKPVVAAVHSVAMGGGLELALGAHYRIAAPGAKIALPEVKLGLIPGAGGTVRLPRVLGPETALNLIVKGDPVNSELLASLPGQKLFDKMASSPETLLEEAVAFAREVAARHADGSPLPLVRHLPCKHPNGDAYFQFARNTVKGMAKNRCRGLDVLGQTERKSVAGHGLPVGIEEYLGSLRVGPYRKPRTQCELGLLPERQDPFTPTLAHDVHG